MSNPAEDKRSELFDTPRGGSGRFVYKYGQVMPKYAVNDWSDENRSDLPAPMVMRDIDDYRSMVDGTIITSRSRHREHLKRHNVVEVGNEMLPQKKATVDRGDVARDVKETIEKLKAGYVNPDEGFLTKDMEREAEAAATKELDGIAVGSSVQDGDYVRTDVSNGNSG